MKCSEVKERLLDYINDDLNEIDRKKIEDHIENCDICRCEFNNINKTLSFIKYESSKIEVPEDFIENEELKLIKLTNAHKIKLNQ